MASTAFLLPAHFNPRTPCGVRPRRRLLRPPLLPTSIHAPLAGCDYQEIDRKLKTGTSIHAPLAGCDGAALHVALSSPLLQSTHPLRGATRDHQPRRGRGKLQSTHPLRGATRRRSCTRVDSGYFNPRTPCGVRPYKQLISD